LSVQELFAGAQYHDDRVWTPQSLARRQTAVTALLTAMLTAGTIALTSAGFAIQVTLTNQRAASVIDVGRAPKSDPGTAAEEGSK
jgi:hypothetical protein